MEVGVGMSMDTYVDMDTGTGMVKLPRALLTWCSVPVALCSAQLGSAMCATLCHAMPRPWALPLCPPVLQEAVSTRDLELVQLVLRYRDYQRAIKRLAGIPVLLEKLRKVPPSAGLWGTGQGCP